MSAFPQEKSTLITIRSKTLAKILRSYTDGKFIYREDRSREAQPEVPPGDCYPLSTLADELQGADLMLARFEQKKQDHCSILGSVRSPSPDSRNAAVQIMLGTTIQNTYLHKLLLQPNFSNTMEHLAGCKGNDDFEHNPVLDQLDMFLQSLRPIEQISADELQLKKGIVQQVFTEEFPAVEKGSSDFLSWVEDWDVPVEELRQVLSTPQTDGGFAYVIEKENELADTVESLRRSGASERMLRFKSAAKGALKGLKL